MADLSKTHSNFADVVGWQLAGAALLSVMFTRQINEDMAESKQRFLETAAKTFDEAVNRA